MIGLALLIGAVMLGINSCTSSDSGGGGTDTPAVVDTPVNDGGGMDTGTVDSGTMDSGSDMPADTTVPEQDFSIQQSCEEVRADYMQAEPGSDEERWALEAAEEVCFSQ